MNTSWHVSGLPIALAAGIFTELKKITELKRRIKILSD